MKLLLDAIAADVERARLPGPVRDLLEAEQRHLGPKVDRRKLGGEDEPGLDPRLLPRARSVFQLPSYWAKASVTISPGASPLVRTTFLRGGKTLCLVHPLAEGQPRRCAVELFATPTASIRTLLVWRADRPDQPFFAKLSLPVVLGGERRTLHADVAAACVRRSTLLSAFKGQGLIPLPETLAVDAPTGAFLVRELAPGLRLLPWFALPKHDARKLLRAFLDAWMTSAIAHGWTPDAHAQNLLVERTTGRFFVRDLEDVSIDLPFIAAAHPKLRKLAAALDPRDEENGLEQSLHGYFLNGPAWAMRAKKAFLDLLPVREARGCRAWVETEREKRLPRPALPPKLKGWLRLEQRVNAQRRSPRHFAKVDLRVIPERFRPSSEPVFRLPYFEVPRRQMRVREDDVPQTLRKALFVGDRVRCFFHPMMAEAHALDLAQHPQGRELFWATPTASPRSLVVWPDGKPGSAFGLKLSLDVELLRLNRLIEAGKLERAVAVSGCLPPEAFREPISIRQRDKSWGSIGRTLPRDMRGFVPGFSLSFRNTDAIIAPLVKTFARLAFGEGLIPDLHQQNVLFHRGQVVVRDLDAFKTDLELRWRRGKSLEPFTRSEGTLAQLKLDVGSSAYDEAWSRSLRTEWTWLAQHTAGRPIRRHLESTFDQRILEEAARWLGRQVVEDELRHIRGNLRFRGEPRYSLNAMIHAWKLRQPAIAANVSAALRRRYQQLLAKGRATKPLDRTDRVVSKGGVLVAVDREGRPRGFAIDERVVRTLVW